MTIAGNQGQNVYPAPDNYPDSSFPQTVPAPDVDPDDAGTLITVQYSWKWREVLMAAVDQLRNPATWQGDHDEIILAVDRATNLKDLLQTDVGAVETPYWDDASDVDDNAASDMQPWYGYVDDPTLPAGELNFFESALVWTFTGLLAVSGTPAAAILFHTIAPKFIIAQKAGDVGEVIRIIVNAEDVARVDTSGRAGEIIETPIIPTESDTGYDVLIVKES